MEIFNRELRSNNESESVNDIINLDKTEEGFSLEICSIVESTSGSGWNNLSINELTKDQLKSIANKILEKVGE